MDGVWKSLIIVALFFCATLGLAVHELPMPDNDIVVTLQRPVTQVEMVAKAMQSVVAVYHPNVDIPASGFYIGRGIIITAGHVAGVSGLEKVVFEDGSEYDVLRQVTHPDYDCGFLYIDVVDKPALLFDLEKVRRGEEIFVLGNPAGALFVVTKGIVMGFNEANGFFGETQLIMVDAVGHGGNSGSVLLDGDGEIRGVYVGGGRANCGSPLHGYGVSICVEDILGALAVAELEVK